MSHSSACAEEFSADVVHQDLNKAYVAQQLESVLEEHWCKYVPRVYQAYTGGDAPREERMAKRLLFGPMERFLCGGDPEQMFAQLKAAENPSQVCAKVFKNGEPTYSCKDCCLDNTCVLCIECFQRSAHRHHRYKMSTSSGGGYCDCGDEEAWKADPCCDIHQPAATTSPEDLMSQLPSAMRERCEALFVFATRHAMRLLTWSSGSALPAPLQGYPAPMDDNYNTILYNDEVHTYDQVIKTLERSIKCTKNEAVEYATTVDRDGWKCVAQGTKTKCANVKDDIVKNTTRLHVKPLKVEVIRSYIVRHQIFSQHILLWLKDVISRSAALRLLYCRLSLREIIPEESPPHDEKDAATENMETNDSGLGKISAATNDFAMGDAAANEDDTEKLVTVSSQHAAAAASDATADEGRELQGCSNEGLDIRDEEPSPPPPVRLISLCELMMTSDTKLWKSSRTASQQLFMAGILKDQACKKEFAVLFTKMFPDLVLRFIQDDHEHSVCAVSQSVQLFTVPTLVRMLISEQSLLEVVLETFIKHCQPLVKEGKFSFEKPGVATEFKRVQYTLYDLKYILTSVPRPGEWNDSLRKNFLRGYRSLLKLLGYIQGMDAVRRQTGQHLEFEPEWEQAFNVQLKLGECLGAVVEWCASDEQVFKEAIVLALQMSLSQTKELHEDKVEMEKIKVANFTTDSIKYSVSTQPISVHIPITRVLAGLYAKLYKFPHVNVEKYHAMHGRTTVLKLLEPGLRVQVLTAQSQAGMWRRNGFSLLNQIYFYSNVRCRTEMFDRDIIMLQCAATFMDPNEFLMHVLNRYGLIKWARRDFDQIKSSPKDDLIKTIITIAEEMLTLLIYILSERYTQGIGCIDETDNIKREIIHLLCIKSMPHSELTKALPEDPYREAGAGVEEAINAVADFKKESSGKGIYVLKEPYYKQYSPFFCHYSRSEQSKSEEQQRKRKQYKKESQALPPPYPVALTDRFSSLVHILDCDIFIHIVSIVLTRALATRSKSFSEAQLERVLHLIGIALHEEHRAHGNNDNDYCFIAKATHGSDNIFTKLTSLVGHTNITHHALKDLITWLVQYFTEVRQLRDDSFAMEHDSSLPPFGTNDAKSESEKRHKADLAAKKRARLMAKMCKMQRDFIKENAALFENPELSGGEGSCDATGSSDMQVGSASAAADSHRRPVALGSSQSPTSANCSIRQTCILCQEEHDVMHNDRAMVLAAFVQKSTVLSQTRGKLITSPDEHDPLFMPPSMPQGVHTSTCGHVMHADCWRRLFEAMVNKERRQPVRLRHGTSYNIDDKEFLCPLCETLSNTVIPLLPNLCTIIKNTDAESVELSFNDWLDGIQRTVKGSIQEQQDKQTEEESYLFVPCPLSSITKMMAESVAKNFQLLFEYVYLDSSDHFSDSMMEMLRKYSTDVYSIGLGVHPDDENIRVPIMSWNTCAYTLQTIERSLRWEQKALFGALPSRQHDCLSALVKFSAVSNQVIQQHVVKKHCVNLLTGLVLTHADHKLQETPGLFGIEMFHYMVSLVLSMPALYAEDDTQHLTRMPTGSLGDQHALYLTFTAHLAQIILTANFSDPQDYSDMEDDSDHDTELLHVYKTLRSLAGVQPTTPLPPLSLLVSHIRTNCLPFLRCSALFFHYLTGIKGPEKLAESSVCAVGVDEEFELLCHYLSMPTRLSSYFPQQGIITELIKSWCIDDSVKQRLSPTYSGPKISVNPPINKLVPLAKDYSELINKVSMFTCPRSDSDESRAPTMCLVCGEMLCSQSYCCQTELGDSRVGAATLHAHHCGGGTCLFLRVRESQILLLNGGSRGCFYPPPYLDDYGETDQGLRRGNPLHLSEERYRKLEHLWMDHTIPEEIAHALEASPNLFSIDWQHL